MDDPREAELDRWMARLAEGDRAAFEPLFHALRPRALRVARAKVPHDQAEDVAQVILMKVFARCSDFEPGKPVLPWFYAIAAMEVRTAHRRSAVSARRTTSDGDALRVVATESDPEAELLERELRRSLDLAVAALDDESAAAIASMVDGGARPTISSSAFRKRVSRAYARLRMVLGVGREED